MAVTLIGAVVASGNPELAPYPHPCVLRSVSVNNDILSLDYLTPAMGFANRSVSLATNG